MINGLRAYRDGLGLPVAIGLATDDLAADWTRLKAAGVEFVEDPTDHDSVSIATLKDPEGNLIQLLQPTRGRLHGAR